MTGTPNDKIASAAENIAAAEVAQAEAASDIASAVVSEKSTEAAEVSVAAAGAAVALANGTAAIANQQAAEIIIEKEEEISWLKLHAQATENSLKEQGAAIQGISGIVTPMMEQLQRISQAILSSTRQNSPPVVEGETAILNPSENLAGPQEPRPEAEKTKKKRRLI